MTVPIFAFNSTPNSWLGQLMDVTDPLNPVPYNLTGYDKVYIVFKKPDGTQWPTDAQMEAEYDQAAFPEDPTNPENPVDLTDANIRFDNDAIPSILDQRGVWEYFPAAKISQNLVKSPFSEIFWVA